MLAMCHWFRSFKREGWSRLCVTGCSSSIWLDVATLEPIMQLVNYPVTGPVTFHVCLPSVKSDT